MAMREGSVAGIPARVFRISFTGELSYEINVPTRWGLAPWEALIDAGADLGITPYGTEAMHVLRPEQGFIIVGPHTDAYVTPSALGRDGILGQQKPEFRGKSRQARPARRTP